MTQQFTVKSAYQSFFSVDHNQQICKDVWKIRAPNKASCFLWTIIQSGLPTVSNLLKRQIVLPLERHICFFCQQTTETEQHLFFECKIKWKMWNNWLKELSCIGPFPNILEQTFAGGTYHSEYFSFKTEMEYNVGSLSMVNVGRNEIEASFRGRSSIYTISGTNFLLLHGNGFILHVLFLNTHSSSGMHVL
ncbi:hypothetical protein Fmac_019417 [Flemingia macrophylla]|uniref:Reverse transcriptase zinc-binding domain-containing protein n=1 Tax=Flemingia macrophylla TaxID=520843 RepID=A0ABD1M7S7_9FABA